MKLGQYGELVVVRLDEFADGKVGGGRVQVAKDIENPLDLAQRFILHRLLCERRLEQRAGMHRGGDGKEAILLGDLLDILVGGVGGGHLRSQC